MGLTATELCRRKMTLSSQETLLDSPGLLHLISYEERIGAKLSTLYRNTCTLGRCSLSTQGRVRFASPGTRPAVSPYPCRCPAGCRSASARVAGCCWWTLWPSDSHWPHKTGAAPLGWPLCSRKQKDDKRTWKIDRTRGMRILHPRAKSHDGSKPRDTGLFDQVPPNTLPPGTCLYT